MLLSSLKSQQQNQLNYFKFYLSKNIIIQLKIIFIIILMFSSTLATEETIKKNTKIKNNYFDKTTTTNMFWLNVEINSVDFKKGCLSTALCHRPTFKLSQTMTLNGQTVQMSWPMEGGSETLLQRDILHPFITHWTLGEPEDVSIGCQIAGTDPSFGFARVCDEATSRRIFQEENVRQTVMRGVRNEGLLNNENLKNENIIYVQMNGRCFNATLAIQKHIERCPWCSDPNLDIKVVGENSEDNGDDGQQNKLKGINNDDTGKTIQLQNILILILSGAVVFSLSGLFYILIIHFRYRKRNKNLNNNLLIRSNRNRKSLNGGILNNNQKEDLILKNNSKKSKRILKLISPPYTQRSLPCSPEKGNNNYLINSNKTTAIYSQDGGEQSNYDIPWDNKFCLVPRQWLLNNGNNQINDFNNQKRPPSIFFSGGCEPIPPIQNQQQIVHPYATCYEFNRTNSIKHQSTLPPQPPPPPPSSLPPSSFNFQINSQTLNNNIKNNKTIIPQQQQQLLFSSPPSSNNNNNSSFGTRHDDSGLDSV